MPLIEKIESKSGTIGIWELSESADDLLKNCQLHLADLERFNSFRAEKRRREFLASRLTLQQIFPGYPEISYTKSSGKPVFKDSDLNISITHSANLAAVIISDEPVGIDIEQLDRNIEKVVTRFVAPSEMDFIKKGSHPQLAKIMLWAAKEAIYKCSGMLGIQFNEQIIIDPFDYTAGNEFSGKLIHPSGTIKYRLNYHLIKNNVLVYCVEK
ncbi:4'-phosphopantetheinyl transferase superfamily protein [Draconibacterium sp. IB214405]|uniref:4'-phosphopantetheinyl transferase family protein n=1 Tax=Draconibacterium sp. IB214405 TaxID=3097352 RepID=UPI002A13D577|nr:4'-phosphopantetheinyl transferase superfamily protein [Draconibacterium sp. IB214405]MDX8341043.1 4'-phosphopantetheinyl transferase superfamily protein [Draconibacterium sp. IB214405]